MKNHIQSSSGLSKAALFVCSESDTSLKNCTIQKKKCRLCVEMCGKQEI
ncbi:MAG: hypothetical protein ACLVJ3_06310 [Coprococcus phoceensis]